MSAPSEEKCYLLLYKHNTPDHIIRHSEMVWKVARVVANGLIRKNEHIRISMETLRAACLLHDIGKYPCILDGAHYHDKRGQRMLEEEGLPEVGRIVARHVILGDRDGEPVREKHVLFYADKRVVHDELVSLEKRFEYLFHTYARSDRAREALQAMKESTLVLERKIFGLLDFTPEDLYSLIY
jgi:putative nucleotidyltransferase with HDIG domain